MMHSESQALVHASADQSSLDEPPTVPLNVPIPDIGHGVPPSAESTSNEVDEERNYSTSGLKDEYVFNWLRSSHSAMRVFVAGFTQRAW